MRIDNNKGLVIYGAPKGLLRRSDAPKVFGKDRCYPDNSWYPGIALPDSAVAFVSDKPPDSDEYQIISAAEAKVLYTELKEMG